MPIELPYWQVHISRIGAMLFSLVTCIIPYYLKSVATPCLLEADAHDDGVVDDGSGGGSSSYADETHGYQEGLSMMQALVTTSMIMVFSFLVALGSLDPNREDTYTKLEVEAHYQRTKKALTKRVKGNKFVDMYKTTVAGITSGIDQITDSFTGRRSNNESGENPHSVGRKSPSSSFDSQRKNNKYKNNSNNNENNSSSSNNNQNAKNSNHVNTTTISVKGVTAVGAKPSLFKAEKKSTTRPFTPPPPISTTINKPNLAKYAKTTSPSVPHNKSSALYTTRSVSLQSSPSSVPLKASSYTTRSISLDEEDM
jgi:hypothetical protein